MSILIIDLIFHFMHYPGTKIIEWIILIISFVYIIIGIIDVWKSTHIGILEKTLWTIGFVGLPWIVGLTYYWIELKPRYIERK